MSQATDTATADPVTIRRQHLDELSRAAIEGRRCPTLRDLLRGCALFKNNIRADSERFADTVMQLMDANDDGIHELLFAVNELTVLPSSADYLTAANAFAAIENQAGRDSINRHEGAARCHFYLAISGVRESAHKVASRAVELAYSPDVADEAADYVTAAVSWLLAANGRLDVPRSWTRESAAIFLTAPGQARKLAERMTTRMLAGRKTSIARDGLLTACPRHRLRLLDRCPRFNCSRALGWRTRNLVRCACGFDLRCHPGSPSSAEEAIAGARLLALIGGEATSLLPPALAALGSADLVRLVMVAGMFLTGWRKERRIETLVKAGLDAGGGPLAGLSGIPHSAPRKLRNSAPMSRECQTSGTED